MNFLRHVLVANLRPTSILRTSYSTTAEITSSQPSAIEHQYVKPETSSEEDDKLYKTVEMELKGNDKAVLESYLKFAKMTATHLDLNCKTWSLRKPKHERFTMYKSVHIFKKHKAQYEFRTYFSFIQFNHLTGSTSDTVLEYLQRNLPEGVLCKTTKVELQTLPEHLLES